MHNEEMILKLQKKYINCNACPLACLGRSKIVFGQGTMPAHIMIVGEAPGAEEDKTGKPFVGRAGQLLRTLLQEIIPTHYSIFISNVVKCRPPLNRKPTRQESKICTTLLLLKEIEIVKPRLIIATGSTALLTLVPQAPAILKARFNLFLYQEIPLVPALHPSFCLRFPKMQDELKKDLLYALLTLMNLQEKEKKL